MEKSVESSIIAVEIITDFTKANPRTIQRRPLQQATNAGVLLNETLQVDRLQEHQKRGFLFHHLTTIKQQQREIRVVLRKTVVITYKMCKEENCQKN